MSDDKAVLEESGEEAVARKSAGIVPCVPGPGDSCPGCKWLTTTTIYDAEPYTKQAVLDAAAALHRAWKPDLTQLLQERDLRIALLEKDLAAEQRIVQLQDQTLEEIGEILGAPTSEDFGRHHVDIPGAARKLVGELDAIKDRAEFRMHLIEKIGEILDVNGQETLTGALQRLVNEHKGCAGKLKHAQKLQVPSRDAETLRHRDAQMHEHRQAYKGLQSLMADVTKERDFYKKQLEDQDPDCKACYGVGRRAYGSTGTWRGRAGGQMVTVDVCDQCWGSGDESRPWPSWRELQAKHNVLTEISEFIAECEKNGMVQPEFEALIAKARTVLAETV